MLNLLIAPAVICLLAMWSLADARADAEETLDNINAEGSLEEVSAIPSITINGRTITGFNVEQHAQTDLLLPESLKNPDFKKKLNNKLRVSLYSHAPKTGVRYAPIEIIEFMDLGCADSCRNIAQRLAKLQERHAEKVKFAHVYMPESEELNPVNFYSKIAQKEGVFWEFREKVLLNNITRTEEALSALVDLNVDRTAIRLAVRRDAERFYRELDQDKLLALKLNLKNPPHLFVNGIHIGDGGIPLDNLEDVILYELLQFKENGAKF